MPWLQPSDWWPLAVIDRPLPGGGGGSRVISRRNRPYLGCLRLCAPPPAPPMRGAEEGILTFSASPKATVPPADPKLHRQALPFIRTAPFPSDVGLGEPSLGYYPASPALFCLVSATGLAALLSRRSMVAFLFNEGKPARIGCPPPSYGKVPQLRGRSRVRAGRRSEDTDFLPPPPAHLRPIPKAPVTSPGGGCLCSGGVPDALPGGPVQSRESAVLRGR